LREGEWAGVAKVVDARDLKSPVFPWYAWNISRVVAFLWQINAEA